MRKELADSIVTGNGWLAMQSPEFRARVLEHALVERYAAGETVYRIGDPVGGIYGLLQGAIAISMAPAGASARLVQLGRPGVWTGEGCFLSRQPRRVELVSLVETWLMYLPITAMDRIAEQDPGAVRRFAQILMLSADALIRVVSDLQRPDAGKRIASVLQRLAVSGSGQVPLTQSQLGTMANASRKQVNAALRLFEASGWVKRSYRSVCILAPDELLRFADLDE